MAIAAVKVIRVSPCFGYPRTQITSDMGIPSVRDIQNTDPASDDKTGENKIIWGLCLLLWIVMRSYSRRLNFLVLFKTDKPNAPIRREENKVEFLERQFHRQKLSFVHKKETEHSFELSLSICVFYRRIFNLEMQNFSLENHHIVIARQPFCWWMTLTKVSNLFLPSPPKWLTWPLDVCGGARYGWFYCWFSLYWKNFFPNLSGVRNFFPDI